MADDEGREEDAWLYGEPLGDDVDLKGPEGDIAHGQGSPGPISKKATKRKLPEDGDEEEVEGGESEDHGGDEGQGEVMDTAEGDEPGDEATGEIDNEEAVDNDDVSDNDDDDDDSEDDGVQVVIGDIKSGQSTAFAAAPPPKRTGPPPDKKGKFAAEDFEATGTINGVPAQDFSLDSLEEKPWRKPGADITDYFNYGFTEETWRAYCDRQKRLRYESGATFAGISTKVTQGQGTATDSKAGILFPKKFNQPHSGVRRDGMGGQGMRREEPRENTIQVRVVMTADRREYGRKNFDNMNMGPPMIPPPPFNMNLPPPPFPPPDFMQTDFFNHPPPGYYQEEEEHGGYEDQQWMDSQWEMGMEGSGMGPSPSVVPLTKVAVVPPPPGESEDSADLPTKTESDK